MAKEGEIRDFRRVMSPKTVTVGDKLNVFIYLDNEERLVATTLTPLVQVGQFACLEVAWINQYGAFLNWGLMKDLFRPLPRTENEDAGGKEVCWFMPIWMMKAIVSWHRQGRPLSFQREGRL